MFQDVVQDLCASGRSTVLSSHSLSEVEALCDRGTIIRAGRAAESGTFDELRQLIRTWVVVDTAKPLESVTQWPGVHDAQVRADHAEFRVDPGELNHLVERMVDLEVRSMTTSPPTLVELFRRPCGTTAKTSRYLLTLRLEKRRRHDE